MRFLKKQKKLFVVILSVLVAAAGMYTCGKKHSGAIWTTAPDFSVSAGQAILIDADTGKVLYEKAADQRAYPASTTKIMTALLTLETLKKYDSPIEQKAVIPAEAVGVEGSSLYLKAGEKISIEDLLYGMMLVSGNDSAVALSCIIGGTEEHFIELMNQRAKELGCSSTHFVNPNGLFDEEHYTTARDLAVITREAMKNKTFRKIVAAGEWNADRPGSTYRHFVNKNKTVRQFNGGNGVKIVPGRVPDHGIRV